MSTIKNQIDIEDYKNAIYNSKIKYVTNYTIESNKHNIITKEQYRIALNSFEDKGRRDYNGEFSFNKV